MYPRYQVENRDIAVSAQTPIQPINRNILTS